MAGLNDQGSEYGGGLGGWLSLLGGESSANAVVERRSAGTRMLQASFGVAMRNGYAACER